MSQIIRCRSQRFAALHALLTGQFAQVEKHAIARSSNSGRDAGLVDAQAFTTTNGVFPTLGDGQSRG
ncbi:hypothetical protein [Boseongicola aestuarii]|jgi:hypothetical protein|uniref:Uncharacterized protein n=1 Tax=Boseongicola aestuarii TaxID=1470561 RepID=A0A238IVV3_9RHOB|nr:hypothetical protein [Boseongicola aestuarii]SMX22537.1 hypothetical protein BOA8489_00634 [Boseongicola aestuarii]